MTDQGTLQSWGYLVPPGGYTDSRSYVFMAPVRDIICNMGSMRPRYTPPPKLNQPGAVLISIYYWRERAAGVQLVVSCAARASGVNLAWYESTGICIPCLKSSGFCHVTYAAKAVTCFRHVVTPLQAPKRGQAMALLWAPCLNSDQNKRRVAMLSIQASREQLAEFVRAALLRCCCSGTPPCLPALLSRKISFFFLVKPRHGREGGHFLGPFSFLRWLGVHSRE